MDKQEIEALAKGLMDASGGNVLSREDALDGSVAGMSFYKAPLLGVGLASDPLFAALKQKGAIGPHFRAPEEWLPGAKSVLSFFFPVSEPVRRSNRRDMNWPSLGWVHARGEGMDMIDGVNEALRAELARMGIQAVSPVRMPDYFSRECEARREYTSNWSERHVAYVCGLGTFGLSKGLITKKGVAGRFTSIVTDLELPPDTRDYLGLYDYCSFCGVCGRNCPAEAISLEAGKDHVKCARFVNQTIALYQPSGALPRRNRRYGCGKCQVKVPCETRPCRKKSK